MLNAGMPNDAASSMMIPYGYRVDLYADDGLTGSKVTIDGPPYVDATLQHACVNMPSGWNDRVSSLDVYKTSQLGQAVG